MMESLVLAIGSSLVTGTFAAFLSARLTVAKLTVHIDYLRAAVERHESMLAELSRGA